MSIRDERIAKAANAYREARAETDSWMSAADAEKERHETERIRLGALLLASDKRAQEAWLELSRAAAANDDGTPVEG